MTKNRKSVQNTCFFYIREYFEVLVFVIAETGCTSVTTFLNSTKTHKNL